MGATAVAEKIQIAEELLRRGAEQSLGHYLQNVVINSQPSPRPFGLIAEPWQRELLRDKLPAFEYLAGLRETYAGPLSFFDVLARGHDKSSLEGRLATWLLIAAKRIIHGYIIAADRDQGRLILQAIEDELHLNPWVRKLITVHRDVVYGPAGEITVLPADAASAYGGRANLFICDEVTHWKNQKMWTAIITTRQKVRPSILCVLSNAGLLNSWQHDAFREAKANPDYWSTFYRTGFLASWVSKIDLERMKRLIPKSEADRLYGNQWIDPAAEHDYLQRFEVDLCRNPTLRYRLRKEPGVSNYIAVMDYGPKRDRTALCVMHADAERKARIDRLDVWQGQPGEPVPIARVEAWIEEIQRCFRPVMWVADGYQMEGTIQEMEAKGLTVERYAARGGAGNFEMAQLLRAAVTAGELGWYPGAGTIRVTDKVDGSEADETLEDELSSLVVKKKPYGYRFDHTRQMHDDRAVVIGMGLTRVHDFPWPTYADNGSPPALGMPAGMKAMLPEM